MEGKLKETYFFETLYIPYWRININIDLINTRYKITKEKNY